MPNNTKALFVQEMLTFEVAYGTAKVYFRQVEPMIHQPKIMSSSHNLWPNVRFTTPPVVAAPGKR